MLHTQLDHLLRAPDRRRGLVRAGVTALTALAVAGATLAAPNAAEATLSLVGPSNPANGFPSFYTEQSGATSLQLCLDGTVACANTTPADLTAPDGEAFYYSATADIPVGTGVVSVEFALEAAFAGPGNGQQIVFDRFRIRGEAPAGTYRLDHPFGSDPVTSVERPGPNINATDDVGCADIPCDTSRALRGRLTNFLRSTSAPAGYLGDAGLASTVTGATEKDGSTPRNLVRLVGPNGTVGQTDKFVVLGKVIDGPVAALSGSFVDFGNTAAASQPVTVTNIGTRTLTFNGPPTGLANGFAVAANTCIAPLATGGACQVTVSYASGVATANAQAALSLPTNTPTGAVTMPLHATTLPVASLSGGPLAFGTQRIGRGSAPRAVTLVNTGVVAMPVTASVTGPFTAPKGCAVPLAPGASCTVSTSYRATARGAQAGTLTVSHPTAANAASSTVSLSGTGRVGSPTAPRGVVAKSGRPGGRVTASVRWTPGSNGGLRITAYRVSIRKVGSNNVATRVLRPSARSLIATRLVRGAHYRFAVRAVNRIGPSAASPFSKAVRAR